MWHEWKDSAVFSADYECKAARTGNRTDGGGTAFAEAQAEKSGRNRGDVAEYWA